jgi:hypothetical protein
MDKVLLVVDDLKGAIAFLARSVWRLRARRPSREGRSTASSGSTASGATSS